MEEIGHAYEAWMDHFDRGFTVPSTGHETDVTEESPCHTLRYSVHAETTKAMRRGWDR